METPANPARTKQRAYVRARARGLSIRAAARAAGYCPDGSCRIEHRLARETAKERRKLEGMNGGHAPARFGVKDGRRIARQELERIVDGWGPNHKRMVEQSLRALAQQVPAPIALELVQSYANKHLKARRDGGDIGRLGRLVHYAGRLLAEIRKREGQPTYPDPHELPRGRGSAEAPPAQNGQAEAGASGQGPCPKHPSQRAGRCVWCDPVDKHGNLYSETPLPEWVRRSGGRY
jgi:hypothetical protein